MVSTHIGEIIIENITTIKKLSPTTEEEITMIPTKVIDIGATANMSEEEKHVQKGLWYMLREELEKIKSGKNSRLAEFIILDEQKVPTSRLSVKITESLPLKIARKLNLNSSWGNNTFTDNIDFPPKDGVDYRVNYSPEEFLDI